MDATIGNVADLGRMGRMILPLVAATIALNASAATIVYEATPEELSVPARKSLSITNIPHFWPWPRSANKGVPEKLFIELWGEDTGEIPVAITVRGGNGRDGKRPGAYGYRIDLPEKGRRSLELPYSAIRGKIDIHAVSNITVSVEKGRPCRFGVARMTILDKGDPAPKVEEAPRIYAADTAAHREDYGRFRDECRMGAFVVGQATSMENIRPRAAFKWRKADLVSVRLARRERESVQILVAPFDHDLRNVNITAEMRGVSFAATNITASVVGYVETKNPTTSVRPDMKPPPRGWWPDPILDFQHEADVKGNDVQSFWVRVTCPENQPPGTYEGELVVSAKGETPARIPLRIRVNKFAVGKASPLPLAISCKVPSTNGVPDKARLEKYCDFFADYYMTYDTLYAVTSQNRDPSWNLLVRLKAQGRLGMFCLAYFGGLGEGPKAEAKWRAERFPAVRERYETAKRLGILNKAYFYGCDEANAPAFTNVQRKAAILHREFPGVPVMTTARDKMLGTGDSPLTDIDIHCPALCFWASRPVRKAQSQGKKVWWYFCNVPSVPYANTVIEAPPIEIRSLMGAQTQKFKPDGFLYYATNKRYTQPPILKGPFTEWDPGMSNPHGDGQWTCSGTPDAMPLATLRLENFRDGLEDLWYVRLLEWEWKIKKMEGCDSSAEWFAAAKAALAVPDEVAHRTNSFSIDPVVLYRWRDNIADLIEATP